MPLKRLSSHSGVSHHGLKAGVNDNEEHLRAVLAKRAMQATTRRADLQQVEREPISTLAKG